MLACLDGNQRDTDNTCSTYAVIPTPLYMVRKERLELSRLAALEPKSSASTNFATPAENLLEERQNPAIPRARILAQALIRCNIGVEVSHDQKYRERVRNRHR